MKNGKQRIAVIGLGAMGSMALWQLSKRGVAVTGYDQYGPPHDRGAHAGQGRFFRMAYHEGHEYVSLLKDSRQLWLDLQAEAKSTVLVETGFLSIGNPQHEWLAEALRCIQDHDLPHQCLSADEFDRRYPQHLPLMADEIAVLDQLGGLLMPELAIRAAINLATDSGADIRNYTPVLEVQPGPNGTRVVTADGGEVYDRVIVTTGAWSALIQQHRPAPITVNRLFHTWFLTRNPEQYTYERFPPFIRRSPGLEKYETGIAGSPSESGQLFRGGATVPYYRTGVQPEHLDREVPLDYVMNIRSALQTFMPGVYPDPIRSAAYMDGYTPDSKAIVDTIGDSLLFMTGYSGHGFKFAPLFGKLSAQWAYTDELDPRLFPFALKRFVQR